MTEKTKEGTGSKRWVFPAKRCPHCRTFNTEATHTDSERGVQYRRCRTPLCQAIRIRFSVKGQPAAPQMPDEIESPSFDCPYCHATYKRQGDLTKHITKVHGGCTPPEKGETTNG